MQLSSVECVRMLCGERTRWRDCAEGNRDFAIELHGKHPKMSQLQHSDSLGCRTRERLSEPSDRPRQLTGTEPSIRSVAICLRHPLHRLGIASSFTSLAIARATAMAEASPTKMRVPSSVGHSHPESPSHPHLAYCALCEHEASRDDRLNWGWPLEEGASWKTNRKDGGSRPVRR